MDTQTVTETKPVSAAPAVAPAKVDDRKMTFDAPGVMALIDRAVNAKARSDETPIFTSWDGPNAITLRWSEIDQRSKLIRVTVEEVPDVVS